MQALIRELFMGPALSMLGELSPALRGFQDRELCRAPIAATLMVEKPRRNEPSTAQHMPNLLPEMPLNHP